jgi:hypothetical protein
MSVIRNHLVRGHVVVALLAAHAGGCVAGAAIALSAAGAGVAVAVLLGARAARKSRLNQKFREDMAKAPEISNPVTTQAVEPAPYFGEEDTRWRVASYEANRLCVEVSAHLAPHEIQAQKFKLQVWKTPTDAADQVPSRASDAIRVVDSTSEMRPVQRVQTDTVRDASGRAIGSVDKTYTAMEPFYTTVAEVCFHDASIVTREAKFLAVQMIATRMPDVPVIYGVWRLK